MIAASETPPGRPHFPIGAIVATARVAQRPRVGRRRARRSLDAARARTRSNRKRRPAPATWSGPVAASVLLDDLDHSLHAEEGVRPAVLRGHEARLHIPARLIRDGFLLKGPRGERTGEVGFSAGSQLPQALFLSRGESLRDLGGGLCALLPDRDVHVHEIA